MFSARKRAALTVFRKELEGRFSQSVFLSIAVSLKYPLAVSRRFGFYFLMLILAVIGAAWNGA